MYCELLCKSNFSFLEGASHPEELVEEAIGLGLKGIALSDLNGVYGIAKGYSKAKYHPNFKYIVGAEVEIKNHPNLQLFAMDRAGYGRLCRTITRAHAGKEKGMAHLLWAELLEEMSEPTASGLLAIPRPGKELRLDTLKELFGDRLYLSLTRHLDGLDRKRSWDLKRLSQKYNIPVVASNDVRYHKKHRKMLHDVFRATKEGFSLKDCGYKLSPNAERYLKDTKSMQRLFRDWPETLKETLNVAAQCTFDLKELRYRYPSEWIPFAQTAFEYLSGLVWAGAKKRYKEISSQVEKQIEHELKLVKELEFEHYFLTIYDIVEFARRRDILCQGRGSAANSIICYVLGITAIDPLQMELLFERFLSAERGEPPDIDVDFEHERREEVIQYIYEKYGRDRAAMVSAVITYRKRSALREVAKAFGVPVGTLSAKKVETHFDELTKDMEFNVSKEQIDDLCTEMKGFPRHLSIHSGGFTLSADPIIEIVPVEPARMPGRSIIQWDKYDLDELGLLKIDVLSLGMLSALKKSLDMIGKELHEIPHDDKPTYKMIQQADTVGTFQIESRAQMSMLGRLQPKNFYDLVVEVAIVRPGPIVGQMVHPYLKRRRGLEKIEYPHPTVEKVLKKTLGIPLFQEQVMKLAIDLAGFTPGEADQLRRAIGAWRSSGSIQKMGDRLRQGLLKSGLSEEFADQFFEQIQGFAHYGFPESHAASFALIAYASCYVKCHHPAEFAVSLINSQPMGFYSNHTIVADARRKGIQALPLSLNESQWDCEVLNPKCIRMGFRIVNGLSAKSVEPLLQERQRKPFKDLYDFLERTQLKSEVNQRLAMAGSFSLFGLGAREALWKVLEYEILKGRVLKQPEQMDLLNPSPLLFANDRVTDPSFGRLTDMEKVQEDFSAFNLTTAAHPMEVLRANNTDLPTQTLSEIKAGKANRKVRAAGLTIIRQKPPTAKGVCFCTLEDESGFMDITFFPNVYKKYKDIFLNHAFIIISGTLQKDRASTNVLVDKVWPIFPEAESVEDGPIPIDANQYFY